MILYHICISNIIRFYGYIFIKLMVVMLKLPNGLKLLNIFITKEMDDHVIHMVYFFLIN
jgi:hypothetical protein